MSKRLQQREREDGTVVTRTSGQPRGDMPSFDVEVATPPRRSKKGTELAIRFRNNDGRQFRLTLNGRQARTLREVLDRHFDRVVREE